MVVVGDGDVGDCLVIVIGVVAVVDLVVDVVVAVVAAVGGGCLWFSGW